MNRALLPAQLILQHISHCVSGSGVSPRTWPEHVHRVRGQRAQQPLTEGHCTRVYSPTSLCPASGGGFSATVGPISRPPSLANAHTQPSANHAPPQKHLFPRNIPKQTHTAYLCLDNKSDHHRNCHEACRSPNCPRKSCTPLRTRLLPE